MDIKAESEVDVDEEELDVISQALNAHDYDELLLTIHTQGGKFQPVMSVYGKYRDARDMDWELENILDVLDTIDWDVSHIEADPKVAQIDFYLSPGNSDTDYRNTRDAVRDIKGGRV